MTRWARGEAEIEQLLSRRELEHVTGAAADGRPLLRQAKTTAATAATLVQTDAYSAYILAYDAARFACTALLAQQGLRPTTSGGHTAVATAVQAQFGLGFRPFATMRRRRNELEYPHTPGETATTSEAQQAVTDTTSLITAAERLLGQLTFFNQP
ncbi:MAG TPA: hypothetical protein VF940_09570 [Streptosporangiaceae bacterium]